MELIPIEDKIYEIRGKRVMLDFDLASMYEVETKRLKEQVRRNIERFPDDFMFQLTKREWTELVANCDQLPKNIKHSYIYPMVFTQEGVAMLSGVLRSPIAVTTNIRIMRAFVAVRELLLNPPVDEVQELKNEMKEMKKYLEDVFTDYNDINEDTRIQLELINEALAKLEMKHAHVNRPRKRIGFVQSED
ncbi:MAG: ORF6N domain-containing protein [Dysgonamonadaceae bacterium]|jgi:hypothetical protein|nr:ORF6N domain-containing protein [Dysgonamonadaceae bacterium]